MKLFLEVNLYSHRIYDHSLAADDWQNYLYPQGYLLFQSIDEALEDAKNEIGGDLKHPPELNLIDDGSRSGLRDTWQYEVEGQPDLKVYIIKCMIQLSGTTYYAGDIDQSETL